MPILGRYLLLLPLVFLCVGCILIPVPHNDPDPLSPRSRINDRALDSIVVGSTTLEEVLFRFGEPQEHYDAPTVFLYRWHRQQGAFVFWAIMYGGGEASELENVVEYTLHVAFDEHNRVSRYKVSKVPLSGSFKKKF